MYNFIFSLIPRISRGYTKKTKRKNFMNYLNQNLRLRKFVERVKIVITTQSHNKPHHYHSIQIVLPFHWPKMSTT